MRAKQRLDLKAQESGADVDERVSQAFLSKLFGLDQTTISKLTSDGVFERIEGARGKNGAGVYALRDSVQRYVSYRVKKVHELSPMESAHKQALIRRAEAAAEKAEWDLKDKTNQTVPNDLVTQLFADAVVGFREAILGIPFQMSRRIANRNTVDDLRRRLEQALEHISKLTPGDVSLLKRKLRKRG
jgi:hypothetical protein